MYLYPASALEIPKDILSVVIKQSPLSCLGPGLGLFLVWVKGNYLIVSKPSPQEEVLLSASHDKTVRIWDLRARGKGPIQVLTGTVDSVLCLMTHGDVPWLRRLEGWEIALY